MKNSLFCVGKQPEIHEKVFVIANGRRYRVVLQSSQYDLTAIEFVPQSRFDLRADDYLPQAGEVIHDFQLSCAVEHPGGLVWEMKLVAAVGDICVVGDGIMQKIRIHLRFDDVVAVYKTDVFASGFLDASQTGGGDTAVFLVDGGDTAVPTGVVINDGGGTVGGTVVDYNYFYVLVCLSQNAVQRGG